MSELKQQKNVLLVSASVQFRNEIKQHLVPAGYRILDTPTQNEALAAVDRETIDVVLLDIEKMPKLEFDLVNYIKSRAASAEIVVFASIHELEEATRALRSGASFYLIKPVTYSHLVSILRKVSQKLDRVQESLDLEQSILADLMAGSPAMQKMLKLALKIAPTSSTVLVGGESGTGKEFFARIIHRMSGRQEGQFVAMNCGSVPDSLLESELFGHKKGSFTGAESDKPGLVEEAHMGTLFLDEVGELSPTAQVKLLRFLQERTFRRIGDNTLRSVNVRVIAATNRDLPQRVREGGFREDLYYRLNVFNLYLPPLRERRETIPSLIRLFVHRMNERLSKNITRISKGAEVVLANYSYPGNVRELENIIEHATVLADPPEIKEKDLPDFLFRNRLLLAAPESPSEPSEILPLKEVEKEHIRRALSLLEYNYTETAKKLGVSRSTLWRKIKEYHIDVP